MHFNVLEVEKPSSITRKMTIRVPADIVKDRIQQGLEDVRKSAKLKGFRPGQAPLSIIRQYYGDDVRHRVFHTLIDESFENAVRDQKLRAVGHPKIDTPEHQTGAGSHDHSLNEDQDLTFTATFEIVPDIQVKNYTGLRLKQDKVDVTPDQIEKVVTQLHESQAQLVPISGGIALADGTTSVRPVQESDFVDIQMKGGLVQPDDVIQHRDDMSGNQVIEVGPNTGWIPGFAEQLVGMRKGETKKFRIHFPKDYSHTELAEKEAEFEVTVNEIKEKKLATLDDDFAQQLGYQNVEDLRTKAREYLERERTEESNRVVRGELITKLIEKNPFDVPKMLVESQTRSLAQELGQDLKKQGLSDKDIQEVIVKELDQLRGRAESQVRASLILESVADQENIAASEDDLSEEIRRLAQSMKVEEARLQEYYSANPSRRADLDFRVRQERTIKFLIDKAKIVASKEE